MALTHLRMYQGAGAATQMVPAPGVGGEQRGLLPSCIVGLFDVSLNRCQMEHDEKVLPYVSVTSKIEILFILFSAF